MSYFILPLSIVYWHGKYCCQDNTFSRRQTNNSNVLQIRHSSLQSNAQISHYIFLFYRNCRPTISMFRGVGTGEAMKPGLHRKSELLLHRNFKHLGYMKGENFRASPEKSSFRRPCRCWMLDNNKVVLTYPFNVKITLDHGCQTSNDISEFRCLQCSLMYIILY